MRSSAIWLEPTIVLWKCVQVPGKELVVILYQYTIQHGLLKHFHYDPKKDRDLWFLLKILPTKQLHSGCVAGVDEVLVDF